MSTIENWAALRRLVGQGSADFAEGRNRFLLSTGAAAALLMHGVDGAWAEEGVTSLPAVAVDAPAEKPRAHAPPKPQRALAARPHAARLPARSDTVYSDIVRRAPTPSAESRAMPSVQVGAGAEAPVRYVPSAASSGTKTRTPILEIPQSISIITREQLNDRNAETLNEALRYSAGTTTAVWGQDSRNDTINTRGFDADVYLDGLSERTFYGTVEQDVYGMESIELLRGPSGSLYGAGSPGGIVNMASKRASFTPKNEVFAGYGTYATKQGGGDVGGVISDNLAWRLTGLVRNGYTQLDHTKAERIFIAPTIAFVPSAETRFDIFGRFQQDRGNFTYQYLPVEGTLHPNPNGRISRSLFASEPGFDHVNRDTWSLGYSVSHRFGEQTTLTQNFRYRETRFDNAGVYGWGYVEDEVGDRDFRNMTRYSWRRRVGEKALTIDTHVEHRFATGPLSHAMLAGVDFLNYRYTVRDQDGDAPTLDVFSPIYAGGVTLGDEYGGHNALRQTGLYLQDQVKFGRLIATLSGRYDFAQSTTRPFGAASTMQDDGKFTGRAGLTYLFDEGMAPYAAYSEGFTPTAGSGADGKPWKPEESRQFEVGVKYRTAEGALLLTAAAYDLEKKNVLTADPNDFANLIQTGAQKTRGLEFEAVAELLPQWKAIASYAYMAAITTADTDYQGKRMILAPRHLASTWLDYSFETASPLAGVSLAAGLRYVGSYFGDYANEFLTPDAVYLDLAARYEIGPWKLAVDANNVTDEFRAVCFLSVGCNYTAGRTVTAKLSYHW